MKYTEEMILHSDSGYCMPFEAPQGEDVELSLGYGEQTHPETGEQFFHHGIDFPVRYRMLAAVADGIVSGVGSDPVHGICQTIRYGEYEVTYGHLSNVYAQFGQRVKAGQTVALSGERLHVGVRFKGEELNPIEFLTMLYGNIRALQEAGGEAAGGFCEPAPATDYEQYRREIEELMLRFLPCYMEDLRRRTYTVPAHTEQSLRHIFTTGAMKEYFYERMPSMYNPLGLGRKALPLVGKVQNLLIADFLNYLALRHEVYHGCDRQQVDGGDPLHSSSVHVEFPHELWEQHRHHGFGEDADEGERADRHDGADEFAGNAFVRRFLDVFAIVPIIMVGGFERCIPFFHNHFPRTFSCGHVRRRD